MMDWYVAVLMAAGVGMFCYELGRRHQAEYHVLRDVKFMVTGDAARGSIPSAVQPGRTLDTADEKIS